MTHTTNLQSDVAVNKFSYEVAKLKDLLPGLECKVADMMSISKLNKLIPARYCESPYTKLRKAIPLELVQRYGEAVIAKSEAELSQQVRKDVTGKLFESLSLSGNRNTETDFKNALAKNAARIGEESEDDEAFVVSFVNTFDAYEHLHDNGVVVNTAFGMSYVRDYKGNDVVFITSDIPQGTLYSTDVKNLGLYYENIHRVAKDEESTIVTNDDGFIGLFRQFSNRNMTFDIAVVYSMFWLPKRYENVIVSSIID